MNVTAKERASRMATELNLPDVQKEKVAVFLEKQDSLRAKRRAEFQRNQQGNREAAQADRDKIRAEMEKERIAQDAELESIIGKEKMDIYKKQREERMQRMRENRENRSRIN
jgi:transcription initiation factor TFIIIB Brf1 subunit/transcription initiation factor TFIIB